MQSNGVSPLLCTRYASLTACSPLLNLVLIKEVNVPPLLTPEQLDELRQLTTPTIANAIECFNIRPRNQGFMTPDIRCMFPDLGTMVGYAVTARMQANVPAAGNMTTSTAQYWEYVLTMPAPRIAVIQDFDERPVGSLWGDVNASVHRALGVIGVVTNGGVRDLDGVHKTGFHFFAREVLVSHAYNHLVDFGTSVEVGGLTIRPGDLLAADRHGVIHIPAEIAAEVAAVGRTIDELEMEIISYCQSRDFTPQGLARVRESVAARWPKPRG
jgi:regulator of RNase E activity RraA